MASSTPAMQFLLCLDGSKEAQAVVPMVAHMAAPTDRVAVFSCFMRNSFLTSADAQINAHQKVVDAAAAELVKELPETQVQTHVEQVGDPRNGIMEHIDQKMARTILMSSRGLSALGAWAIGSVSSHVLHNTRQGTAVVIARGLELGSKSIHYMLCTDGSVRSQRAADHLAEIVKPEDRVTIYVSYVMPPKTISAFLPVAEYVQEEVVNAQFATQCAERLEEARGIGEHAKHKFAVAAANRGFTDEEKLEVVVKGIDDVRQGILAAADEMQAQVIVVGSRGTGELVGAVLGSVSMFLSHHIEKRALMVVH